MIWGFHTEACASPHSHSQQYESPSECWKATVGSTRWVPRLPAAGLSLVVTCVSVSCSVGSGPLVPSHSPPGVKRLFPLFPQGYQGLVDGGDNIAEANWESVSSILQVVRAEPGAEGCLHTLNVHSVVCQLYLSNPEGLIVGCTF